MNQVRKRNRMECLDCNQEMIKLDSVKVLGLDKEVSMIDFFVCWTCKRHRIDIKY